MTHPPTVDDLRRALPAGAAVRVEGDATVAVRAITHDSRRAGAGTMFACLRGEHHDGHAYAADAVRAGSPALLVDHPLELPVTQLVVADTRLALGPVAAEVHGRPSATLRVVGVTGTNGKTTTTALLAAILRAAGLPTGVIGTLAGTHTTPEAPDLQDRLARLRDQGDQAVAMEVSSHALALHRVDGTRFAAAVFTNLGVDHLDLHRTMEDYFRAKASLFTPELAAIGVVNVDDVHGRLLADAAPIEMVPYSRSDATDVEIGAGRHAFTWRGTRLDVALGGSFNVMNTLAAATTAAVMGVPVHAIAAGLATAAQVPGRFEPVASPAAAQRGVTVIVDYAHTPDGLEHVVAAARQVAPRGRVILVFGCGGDRDHAKRPLMGAVASRLADTVVVTSDNPRTEAPLAIIDAVLDGVTTTDRAKVAVEVDRQAAIARALAAAGRGDIVVIAGKGHETTQTTAAGVVDFDDRVVARRLLEAAT